MTREFTPDFANQPPREEKQKLGNALLRLAEQYHDAELTGLIEALQKENDELRQENEELANLAYTDTLTGLANRRGFLRQAARILEELPDDTNIALLYIDLRYFKQINDYPGWGHDVGDDVLKIAAGVLQSLVRHESIGSDGSARPADAIGRLGGDEFAVMLPLTGEGAIQDEAMRALIEQIVAAKVQETLDKTHALVDHAAEGRPEYPGIARLDTSGRDLLQRSIAMNVGITAGHAGEMREPGAIEQRLREADSDMYDQKRKPNDSGATPGI